MLVTWKIFSRVEFRTTKQNRSITMGENKMHVQIPRSPIATFWLCSTFPLSSCESLLLTPSFWLCDLLKKSKKKKRCVKGEFLPLSVCSLSFRPNLRALTLSPVRLFPRAALRVPLRSRLRKGKVERRAHGLTRFYTVFSPWNEPTKLFYSAEDLTPVWAKFYPARTYRFR